MFLKLPSRIDADLLAWLKFGIFNVFVVDVGVGASLNTSPDAPGQLPQIETDPQDDESVVSDVGIDPDDGDVA